MPLSRSVLERQIALAKTELSDWVAQLSKDGVDRAGFRNNARWRTLNARCDQIQRRLNSLAAVEANNAEVARRKAEAESPAE